MAATETQTAYKPWRCVGVRPSGEPCRQLIAQAYVAPGSIVQIKCHRCGTLNTIDKRHEQPAA